MHEAAPIDLTSQEVDELQALLDAAGAGAARVPVELVDGYLCGVLVQPAAPSETEWLDEIVRLAGGAFRQLPPTGLDRLRALVRRRHSALNRNLAEEGWFEPLVFGFDDEHPIAVSEYEPLSALPPASQALAPWVTGFVQALDRFPALGRLGDSRVDELIGRLRHHLPPTVATAQPDFDRDDPLAGLDDAIDDLVQAVAEIADRTRERRYRVETVRRHAPKVGRNEPCPCGSGRKFKHCHGAG